MFFWSRGDEFDDVQNLLRGNTIFADNMFLNITPNGVSFHDISHYSDYLHAFIFHTYNYIYSHFIPSVFSIFSILIMFLIAKLLTGKIIGMGDVKLYMVLALNAEYRIIYVIIISMFMWLTFYIIKNHIMKTCLVRNSKLKIHATKKSDTNFVMRYSKTQSGVSVTIIYDIKFSNSNSGTIDVTTIASGTTTPSGTINIVKK